MRRWKAIVLDAIYLSSSRQMLEPILEETSEDEEHAQNSWNQYENSTSFYSSAESETGSVIRIEVHKEADSISERDFVCPAKRPRRSEDFLNMGMNNMQQSSLDDTVILRRYQRVGSGDTPEDHISLEHFLAYEAASRDSFGSQAQQMPIQRSSTGSRRFDEFYADADSLSYNSLSRSSSLIQFESLERQLLLQEQHASTNSLGASSPSLLSFDGANTNANAPEEGGRSAGNSGNNSRRGSQSSLLKRFESTDGRLHQTYFDLDKLNFDDEIQKHKQQHQTFASAVLRSTPRDSIIIGELRSDSESSSSSSGNSILTASKPSAEDLTDSSTSYTKLPTRSSAFQQRGIGVKNSFENLSEDSGYCEPSLTLRRVKSKSIPKNFDKFCEEEEEFQHEYNNYIGADEEFERKHTEVHEKQHDISQNIHKKNIRLSNVSDEDEMAAANAVQPKINDATFTINDDDDDGDGDGDDDDDDRGSDKATTAIGAICSPLSVPVYYGNGIKNSSPTQEQFERSLAHSPSPASSNDSGSSRSSGRSARSSTSLADSVSTCASAASFTWQPMLLQKQQQQQEHKKIERSELASMSRTTLAEYETNGANYIHNNGSPSLGELCASLRNSLPDIRDVYGQEAVDPTYFTYKRPENGYVLDQHLDIHIKTAAIVPNVLRSDDCTALSATSTTTTYAPYTAVAADECEPPVKSERRLGSIVKTEGGGSRRNHNARLTTRISSVPNELDKLGRSHKRGGKARYCKSSTDEEEEADDTSACSSGVEDDFFDTQRQRRPRRRSCSWSERRNVRNSQRERGEESCAVGYLNASYQNLTLLDYTSRQPNMSQNNFKRGTCSDQTEKRRSTGSDYESIICKGNFLLDELSQIYDRNASILNDRTVDALLEEPSDTDTKPATPPQVSKTCSKSPVPPPRQRKHSNSSYSDMAGSDAECEVQHVQLTLRPARQPRKSEKTNSLIVSDVVQSETETGTGRTFDQDPTNLRTSYAQSLEKCNFDAKELSNTELRTVRNIPKRRFHTQAANAKQKNLVSSTPNLNAYDACADGDIEDDIYVSSAHTSMHQLPQGGASSSGVGGAGVMQKPLGILLPAGSRTSFGKEVSFCPVVSKYCWQEQSSEECTEPHLQRQDGQEDAAEEQTDDELLDNADATVIFNTKENEMIATRLSEEQTSPEILRESTTLHIRANAEESELRASVEETKTSHEAITTTPAEATAALPLQTIKHVSNVQADASRIAPGTREVSLKPTIVEVVVQKVRVGPTESDVVSSASAIASASSCACANDESVKQVNSNRNNSKNATTRPLSIQLPILSEPPINRAHHILYASQQFIDQCEEARKPTIAFDELEYTHAVNQQPHYTQLRAKSVNSLQQIDKQQQHRMSSGLQQQAQSQQTQLLNNNHNNNNNNNNELVKSKFKADEKHPSSKGFLARFAHGFRFSLRRNKKKQLQQKDNTLPAPNGSVTTKTAQQPVAVVAQQQKQKHPKSQDFVYIPLKGPLPEKAGNTKALSSNVSAASSEIGAKLAMPNNSTTSTLKVVTGKPPLPKQPPRSSYSNGQSVGSGAGATHAQQQMRFLETERSYYDQDDSGSASDYATFKNQLMAGMQANGCNAAAAAPRSSLMLTNDTGTAATEFTSPSRASVAQKTQIFQSLAASAGANGVPMPAANGRLVGSMIVRPYQQNSSQQSHNCSKIGLIETNLDTHETIISGKTRSLLDIVDRRGSNGGTRRSTGGGKRTNLTGGICNDVHEHENDADVDDDDDDDDDDVNINVGGVGVVLKSTSNSQAGQIASVRRPHKSMEFLLDKENQKNVLVSNE